MAGFIIYMDAEGRPKRVEEYETFVQAAAVVVHKDEKVLICTARNREILSIKRPELKDILFPPKAVEVIEEEADEPINPDMLRSKTMACKKGGKRPKK